MAKTFVDSTIYGYGVPSSASIQLTTVYFEEVENASSATGWGMGLEDEPYMILPLESGGLDQIDAYLDFLQLVQELRPPTVNLNPDPGDDETPRGGNDGYGIYANAASKPKWLTRDTVDSAVLTRRGWEVRASGNGNPRAYELIVSGGFGLSSQNNDPPQVYNGIYPINRLLQGISGAAIDPFLIEVVDPNKILNQQVIRVGSTSNVPSGLSIVKISDETTPTDVFVISGTPTQAGSGTMEIIFDDSTGGFTIANVTYSITS